MFYDWLLWFNFDFPFTNICIQTLYSSGIEDNPTVFYQLIRGSTDQTNKYDTFYLQQKIVDGWTYADIKVNHPLDYERIKEYNLTVRVEVKSRFKMSILYYHQIFLNIQKFTQHKYYDISYRIMVPSSLRVKQQYLLC